MWQSDNLLNNLQFIFIDEETIQYLLSYKQLLQE